MKSQFTNGSEAFASSFLYLYIPDKGVSYLDRAIELYKRSMVGKFSISHYQAAEAGF